MKDLRLEEIFEESPRENSISLIANFDTAEDSTFEVDFNDEKEIPVLPLRNMMLFPGTMLPINIRRKSSLKLLNEANKTNKLIGVFCQKDDNVEEPDMDQLYLTGVIAKVVRILQLPDGSKTALLQGFNRIHLCELHEEISYMVGHVRKAPEEIPSKDDPKFTVYVDACKETADKFLRSGDGMMAASSFAINNIQNKVFLINFICANLPISNNERIMLLEEDSLQNRATKLLEILHREYQYAKLKASIQMRTHEDLSRQQREHFLQQEMKSIKEELGDTGQEEIDGLYERAEKKKWSQEVAAVFKKEVEKLCHMNEQSPDYNVQYNYLDTMLSLPWNEYTKDNLNLTNAERVLNKDHYGMEKVKERILEHLAVLKMRGDFKSPIICLYGPPGVGKTSLGKSIAKAMKRQYVRVSLGGLHDESEIRGHRKTYIGAMPGRIIKNMIKAQSSNPVFILDEIDKVSQQNFNGDPSSALLEVLDPEQNSAFHDNFLDVDYDLSKVMFIATANNISNIPAPLLDRMELIEVSGYLTEEKVEIARRHLVPKELENLGMADSGIKLTKPAIEKVIEGYTRESGVRELDKKINKLLRKLTLNYAKTAELPKRDLRPEDVETYLGPVEFTRDKYQGNEYAGVVTGLAWTAVGGEILFVETSLSRGKSGKLTLTGNLGDVMKESAVLALEYLKAHAGKLGIDSSIFDNWNIHIHVPEGAVPKDGPSAGITIATSIASALTQRKVRQNIAMTGEITLRGKVLPVGGIKEKILAAKRAGIKDIMLCHENEKDIKQIPEIYVKGVTFHYVENVEDVLSFALLNEKVADPLDFSEPQHTEEAGK